MSHSRPPWDAYFMDITFQVARRSTCDRARVGALIVKDKRILTTGYNGAPAGLPHCLPQGKRVRLAHGTSLAIDKIANQVWHGDNVEVRSYDTQTGEIVNRRVANAFLQSARLREWITIVTNEHDKKNKLVLSPEHKVYLPETRMWVEAARLKVGDKLLHDTPAPTQFQEQVLIGCSLGDGSAKSLASWKAYLRYLHSKKQEEYAVWKAQILQPFSTVSSVTGRAFGREWEQVSVYCKVHASTAKKILLPPVERIKHIDEVGLACWYQDDGVKKSGNRPHICTYGWAEKETQEGSRILTRMFGIHFHTERHSKYYGIGICGHSKDDFYATIAPYMHPSMQYKIPEPYRTGLVPLDSDKPSSTTQAEIVSIEAHTKKETAYDLEVEGTHCFFTADGVLVSNCDEVGHLMIGGHCVRTLHAEQNAIIQAALHGVSVAGGTIYVTHQPCLTCAKMIINAGIRKVIYGGHYPDENAVAFLREAGVELAHYPVPNGESIPDDQTD